MPHTPPPVAADVPAPYPATHRAVRRPARRIIAFAVVLLSLLLLALLPPYINVNRYQRRIVTSMSRSLGRPVHLDSITLNLLPLPSFTLQNVVVDEDPAFGFEPIIRANSVTARLRSSSLWRRRVEFSTISFQEPSVNLVHNPDGKWNLDSILLQASRATTAPTAERHAGPAPRFPYIEATGARLNLKLGQEKTPFSLTDADFALWQGNPSQWRFRLKATPARTDANVTDTGSLELEATLDRAPTLSDVPLNLHATWKSAPLGQTSLLLAGKDAGLRGDMTLIADATGAVGAAALHTRLHLRDLRRDQFVPEHPLTVDLDCLSDARNQFHTFNNIRCAWPVPASDGAIVALTGSIPDLRSPGTLDLQVGATRLPANTLIEWLHVASSRTPLGLTATGYFNGTAAFNSLDPTRPPWSWQASLGPMSLTSPMLGAAPLAVGPIDLTSSPPASLSARHPAPAPPLLRPRQITASTLAHVLTLSPTTLELGARDPALIEGAFDTSGYRLHLAGNAVPLRLLALAQVFPYFGDGLAAALQPNQTSATLPVDQTTPTRIDLLAQRSWGYAQTWTNNTIAPRTSANIAPAKRRRVTPVRR